MKDLTQASVSISRGAGFATISWSIVLEAQSLQMPLGAARHQPGQPQNFHFAVLQTAAEDTEHKLCCSPIMVNHGPRVPGTPELRSSGLRHDWLFSYSRDSWWSLA